MGNNTFEKHPEFWGKAWLQSIGKLAVVHAVACIDKAEKLYNQVFEGKGK